MKRFPFDWVHVVLYIQCAFVLGAFWGHNYASGGSTAFCDKEGILRS